MPSGLETQSLSVDPSVAPVVLVVMFVAFLVGAVGPFALCVLGSIRDERAMRRLAAGARAADAQVIGNPVDPVVVPAVAALQTSAPDPTPAAANDQPVAQRRFGR